MLLLLRNRRNETPVGKISLAQKDAAPALTKVDAAKYENQDA